MKSIRLRTALCAAALALVATALAPSPAQAAEPEQHCVIPLTNLDHKTCFATLEEALNFANGGKDVAPGKGSATARTAAGATAAAAIVQVAVATWFDGTFWTGSSVTWVGFSGACDNPIVVPEYQLAVAPAPYNNWMGSFTAHNNCWQEDYDWFNFTGTRTPYRGGQAVVGQNNDVSSALWS